MTGPASLLHPQRTPAGFLTPATGTQNPENYVIHLAPKGHSEQAQLGSFWFFRGSEQWCAVLEDTYRPCSKSSLGFFPTTDFLGPTALLPTVHHLLTPTTPQTSDTPGPWVEAGTSPSHTHIPRAWWVLSQSTTSRSWCCTLFNQNPAHHE